MCAQLNRTFALIFVVSYYIIHPPKSRSILLAIIVEKAKKCLDFSVTLFLIHVIACTLYDGIPGTWDWWIIHIFGAIVMILLGEYICSRRELDEIPLLDF